VIPELFRKLLRKGRPNRTSIGSDGWEIDAPQAFPVFLRSLPSLFDADSLLYLEDTDTPPPILGFLREHETGDKARIPGGTLFPKPNVFYVPITTESVDGLASLLESTQGAPVPTHVHVNDSAGLALQWYDASAGDPMLVRASVDAGRIIAFCERIGSSHRRRG